MDLPAARAATGSSAGHLAHVVDGGGAAVDDPADFGIGGDVAEADEHGEPVIEISIQIQTGQE
ncbi:MAG TPA: hypothetical protein VK698_18030 [Kofleriaceae bacterium]|nr:hypothetical protein [Kofleriaceae bacterium]